MSPNPIASDQPVVPARPARFTLTMHASSKAAISREREYVNKFSQKQVTFKRTVSRPIPRKTSPLPQNLASNDVVSFA